MQSAWQVLLSVDASIVLFCLLTPRTSYARVLARQRITYALALVLNVFPVCSARHPKVDVMYSACGHLFCDLPVGVLTTT